MLKTPFSTLNLRIRGKKVEFLSDDDEKLITKALSFVWIKTNKKIEASSGSFGQAFNVSTYAMC